MYKYYIGYIARKGDGFGMSMFIGPSDLIYGYADEPQHIGIKFFITERDVIPFAQHGVFIKPGTTACVKVN